MSKLTQAAKQSQENFLQNAKKNQLLVEEIRNCEKELLKRSKKFIQNITVAAHSGISVSEIFKSFLVKFENSDISMIQRVCSCLSQCGEIVNNIVKIMDHLQLELDRILCEPLKSLIEGELAVVTNGTKLDSIKVTAIATNPKVSQVVQNTHIAIDKFEIESLNQFTNLFSLIETIDNKLDFIENMRENVEVAKKQTIQLESEYEDNLKMDSSTFKNYFGIPLKKLLDEEGRTPAQIPLGLDKAMKFLHEKGLDKVGLFRISSTNDKINYAKMRFFATNYRNEDPHLVANLVKMFIKEIPGSLFPKTAIPSMQKWDNELISGIDTDTLAIDETIGKKVASMIQTDLTLVLTPENYSCLKYLMTLLNHLMKNESSKMNADAISTCVAPSVFYQEIDISPTELLNFNKQTNRIFSFMIDKCESIFPTSKKCFSKRKKSVYMMNPEELELPDISNTAPSPLSVKSTSNSRGTTPVNSHPSKLSQSSHGPHSAFVPHKQEKSLSCSTSAAQMKPGTPTNSNTNNPVISTKSVQQANGSGLNSSSKQKDRENEKDKENSGKRSLRLSQRKSLK